MSPALVHGGLIAILRAPSTQHFSAVTGALIEAGVTAVEVTLTTPGAATAITALVREFGDRATIGAGTVLTTGQARACIDAGARFLVSPTVSLEVISTARQHQVEVFPGALTPTEIATAVSAGATAVKLFPASAVAPRFITDLHGPFPDLAVIPTGGIAIDQIGAWLQAGAVAVGLGSPLIGSAGVDGPDEDLTKRARQAVSAVAELPER
jgi:2-dehydro-3-deoxyphosphogluconate aldolase / (4S)-4-hydroxy-2-oxoglutarate aldolase